MFKDDDDINFAKKLLHGVLQNGSARELIDQNTQNWELDRIVFMDILIMEVAISELIDFPTIPINVTLNSILRLPSLIAPIKVVRLSMVCWIILSAN